MTQRPFSPAIDKAAAAQRLLARLKDRISPNRLMTDPLYTYAYSGDASAYRLVPALVVIVNTEDEVRALCPAAVLRAPLRRRAVLACLSAARAGLC